MAADYLSFFKLNDDPFRLTPDTAYFYNSPAHSTALLSIEYCVTQKEGFCVLTGEPGTGKTTILRLFTEKWKNRAEIALIMTPRLLPDEFFRAILDDFKIPLSQSKNDMLKAFRGFLLKHAASDRRVAIIVDEAQELPGATLEELRLLSNLETEKEKLLQIILIGQPELRTKLLSEPLRQLNQRITVRVQLKPLTKAETSDYINTRLIKGGNSSLLFNQIAKDQIFELSGGIPRTINLLASRALMCAYLDGSREVLEKQVLRGATDVMEPLASNSGSKQAPTEARLMSALAASSASGGKGEHKRRLNILTVGIILAVVGASLVLYFGNAGSKFSARLGATGIISPKPVAPQISSARENSSSSRTAAEPLSSAVRSFQILASAWGFPSVVQPEPADTTPDKFFEDRAVASEMQLFRFDGSLDRLIYLDYPAIIVEKNPATGKETYSTLVKVSGNDYITSSPDGAKRTLTRQEMESVWKGKAVILWKNHKNIPSTISIGAKSKEAASLRALIAATGAAVGKSGAFDKKTEGALRSFQKAKGLKATGQPDPQTLLHLYKESPELSRPKLTN